MGSDDINQRIDRLEKRIDDFNTNIPLLCSEMIYHANKINKNVDLIDTPIKNCFQIFEEAKNSSLDLKGAADKLNNYVMEIEDEDIRIKKSNSE